MGQAVAEEAKTSAAQAELARAARARDAATEAFHRAVIRAAESGISQREIAKTLGVTQSAVSQMIAAKRARAKLAQGPVGRKLIEHRAEVLDIARSRGASNVRVFGSVARGEDDEDSDLDLLVNMPRNTGMFQVSGLGEDLAEVLGVHVDVIPEHIVKRDALLALKKTAVAV
ncbi:nucleotidyltransferase domain-containing protein [Rathayibacter soli]|uniref:nucleotidyltransferase domain-containing protein n=1 Tax=Rathayibacter soli TaxID=3144168 RepID=UPI0027E460F1|nr:nucleotidyltransferase domain-containing protein [Glaciibacter superstes]